MEFFGMGTGEIVLIIIIALIIFGPGKLPEIARQVGKAVSTLKQQSSEITTQLKKEMEEIEKAEKALSKSVQAATTIYPVPKEPAKVSASGAGPAGTPPPPTSPEPLTSGED